MHYRRRSRQPAKRSQRWLLWTIASILLFYSVAMILWPLPETTASPLPVTIAPGEPVAVTWPSYGQSALGTTAQDTLLATHGTQETVPIASITKIVTALVVLEKKPMTDSQGATIRFTDQDVTLYNEYLAQDGSVIPVADGLELTQYQTLQTMLIASANNYSDSLAIWAYGSLAAYVTAANQYLASQGLDQTVIADASGFSAESKSSASDLVKLGKLALSNTVIADIVSQKTATIPQIGTIRSTNILLGTNGVIGIKTGTTDEAGACLLYAATFTIGSTPITIVGATLGAPNHQRLAADVTAILGSAQSGFQERQVAAKGDAFARYESPWDATAQAVITESVSLITWADSEVTTEIDTINLTNGDSGSIVGSVTFTGGISEVRADLELDQDLPPPSIWWRLTHPLTLIRG